MSARSGDQAMGSAQGEGHQVWFVGTLATIRVHGDSVGGRFALIKFLLPRGASPPRHTHRQDETYIVLDGQLTVAADEKRLIIGAGGTAVVPMGVPHTFRVDTDTARVIVLSTPAGIERMVLEGSTPAAAPTLPPADAPRPAPEELARTFAAHGQVNCGPPLGPYD